MLNTVAGGAVQIQSFYTQAALLLHSVSVSGMQVTGNNVPLIASMVKYDSDIGYDINTGIYTVPVGGNYEVSAQVCFNNSSGSNANVSVMICRGPLGGPYTVVGKSSETCLAGGVTTCDVFCGDTFAQGDNISLQVSGLVTGVTGQSSDSTSQLAIALL